ncbi:retinol dehydrogenase 8-like [Asterias rubens]|uniref:retinol dehydrogenase 8-like n=1 Tax=Asterias rubens TaxID=7604 RepID=UPI001454F213|nr:retinol dehydrogenase 8-like [Asterias rubens]
MGKSTVLITGCSSGIGLAAAVMLAQDPEHKYKVYATMRNLASKDSLEKAAGSALNETLFIRTLDVTKDDTVTTLVEDIIREDGKIDVLVNNAGIGGTDGILYKSMEWSQGVMDTNFWGVVRLTRAVLPSMKERKAGRIINISSMVGINGLPFLSIYSASKFAMEGYTESIAPILLAYNIRVSLIEPAGVLTEIITKYKSIPFEKHVEGYDDVMRGMYIEMMTPKPGSMTASLQTADDIAKIVKEVTESESPHLRYQSTEAVEQLAGRKWVDPTGDNLLKPK